MSKGECLHIQSVVQKAAKCKEANCACLWRIREGGEPKDPFALKPVKPNVRPPFAVFRRGDLYGRKKKTDSDIRPFKICYTNAMVEENQIALYRKYRPQTFDEVIGQESIVQVLKKSIADKRIAHAYLFAGGRGTGKTSIARLLAKEIGTSSKDLYEMDAASNRNIDDFRELNDSVHTLPFESSYKVYIIDEVHMLTKYAFNAFLKTLEEPPKHAVFILATTEIDKLPDTIVSRCQAYTFKKPTRSVLATVVQNIAKKENISLESDAAELIALLADGSFRDALGVLQKVISYSSDKKISRSEVEAVTGAPKADLVNTLVEALVEGSQEKALTAIGEVVATDTDFLTFQKLVLDKVRAVLLLKNAPASKNHLEQQFGEEDFAFLQKVAGAERSALNAKVLLKLLEAYTATPHAYIKQLPLEIAIVETLTT